MGANEPSGDGRFIRRVLILLGIGATVLVVFVLRELLILVFGSIVVAVLLAAITERIQRYTKIKRGFALALTIFALLGLVFGAVTLFRTQVLGQAQQLTDQIPAAWNQARGTLGQWGIELPELNLDSGGAAQEDASDSAPPAANPGEDPTALTAANPSQSEAEIGSAATGWQAEAQQEDEEEGFLQGGGVLELGQGILGQLGRLLTGVFGAVAYTLLVIAGGIYFAAQPKLYQNGILYLFPKRNRPLMSEALHDTARSIKLWLLGTMISMGMIGFLTGVGLWLIGVPSPLALGLLAGLLEFVPIIGPIAAAIPAILIAFTQSSEMALWTLGFFIVLQQVEGNVVQPIVQKYAVDLPPALLLFSVVAGGYLFGIVGILFAAPLTVAAYVLVRRLYVEEGLDTDIEAEDEPQT